jgi:hypothetical protein
VLIYDPPVNSIAASNSTIVLAKGTTLMFGSRVYITNDHGGFNSHLANPRELEASAPTSNRDINKLADDLGEIKISNVIRNHKNRSGSNSATTRDEFRLQLPLGYATQPLFTGSRTI